MNFSKQRNWIISVLLLITVIISGCNNGLMGASDPQSSNFNVTRSAANASVNAENTFAIMAPLHMNEPGEMSFSEFEDHIAVVAGYGVQAISVDVWWGDVEKDYDNDWDWSYYDTVFEMIVDAGMQIVPIMSFHKCGGGPGDDYTSKIPDWVWNTPGVERYKDEVGNTYDDYVSHWSESAIINQYEEFMNNFEARYSEYAASGNFMEVNISAGPTGELRYPSYNKQSDKYENYDIWDFPARGKLMGYSDKAIADFQSSMIAKYGNASNVGNAWGFSITEANHIQPPSQYDVDSFLSDNYSHTAYKYDFLRWYNESLVEHGSRLIDTARSALDSDAFNSIPLGMKIPGIHWQMQNTSSTRSAEYCAGIVSPDTINTYEHGYSTITAMLDSKDQSGSKYDGIDDIILHFTCLEMINNSADTSRADDLVDWVSDSASSRDVRIKGENALANLINWGDTGWSQIENAYYDKAYEGFTGLRLRYINEGTVIIPFSSLDPYNPKHAQSKYANFINNYPSATISPTNISSSHTNNSITVSWNGVSGASSYKVYSTSGNNQVDLTSEIVYSGSDLSFTHSGLTEKTTYNYKILAVSSAGLSGLSVVFSDTTGESGGIQSNFGDNATLTLTGEDFGSWNPANTTYELELVDDYTWELKNISVGNLNNSNYKLVLNKSWDVNWGGGASGLNTSLSRNGDNAKVSLSSNTYTLRVTEGSSINDSINIEWIPDSNPTKTTVTFTVYNGYTYNGQSMYVIGDITELGSWDPANAVKMSPVDSNGNSTYPTWQVTIEVPANTLINWKFIKREEENPSAGLVWMSGSNQSFTTPSSGNTTQSATFQ